VRILLAPHHAGAGWALRAVQDDGQPLQGVIEVGDRPVPDGELPDLVARLEVARPEPPRWVWPDTTACYPALVRAGVRVRRSHDLALTEALLLGHQGDWGAPRSLAAGYARLTGAPVPDDPSPPEVAGATLFDDPAVRTGRLPASVAPVDAVQAVHLAQLGGVAVARAGSPGFGLLVAAESASGLAAVEMAVTGLPWRVDRHEQVLTELLGPRPAHGGRPGRLVELAAEICTVLAAPSLNPDSPTELLAALRRAGLTVQSTRRWELRRLDHPVIAPLLRYKELARLHAAHGWAWREQWVRNGRFHPEYIPGGVVSGRWATRGGGALQIPKAVRGAVAADPGWALVIADAGQLEPRLLAAISGDPGMIAATAEGDLYAAIAAQALGRPDARADAKLGLLSAMYGGGAGSAALGALRRRFPQALQLLEQAAEEGERGGVVRSVLGRTCPAPKPGWLSGPEEAAAARARARGRFTRNFVVQASAADWAGVLIAGLRRRLAELPELPAADGAPGHAELVFFQHDEVLVHTPLARAEQVVAAVAEAGQEATRMVVGRVGVQIPLEALIATSYAQKGGGPVAVDQDDELAYE
jgi:DNA polymerase I